MRRSGPKRSGEPTNPERTRLRDDRLRRRRLFGANFLKPVGYALLAAALTLVVGVGRALGYRREFWLHPQTFADAMSSRL